MASRYFWAVSHSPLERTALCLGGLRQGRSASWRCDASRYALRTLSRAPYLVYGCSCGLGRLWNRSVTRPWPCPWSPCVDVVLDRPQHRQRRFLSMSLSSCKRDSDTKHRVSSPAVSTFTAFGFGPGTACRYLRRLSPTARGRSAPFSHPYVEFLIWIGL